MLTALLKDQGWTLVTRLGKDMIMGQQHSLRQPHFLWSRCRSRAEEYDSLCFLRCQHVEPFDTRRFSASCGCPALPCSVVGCKAKLIEVALDKRLLSLA